MKLRDILLGGLTVLASSGVVHDYVLKKNIVDGPIVRGYNGIISQISYLDSRIQNEDLDNYSLSRLEQTRNYLVENRINFYAESNQELLQAEQDIKDLDKRQWLLFGLAGLGMAGLFLSRRLSK